MFARYWRLVVLIASSVTMLPAIANGSDYDGLEQYAGYYIIGAKTIAGYVDKDGKREESFQGCRTVQPCSPTTPMPYVLAMDTITSIGPRHFCYPRTGFSSCLSMATHIRCVFDKLRLINTRSALHRVSII
jgi:hypothetical protein